MNAKFNSMLDTEHTLAKELFDSVEQPWEVLPKIKEYILELQKSLGEDFIKYGEDIYIHNTAIISDKATIIGPTIIGAGTEVRPGAYIRGNALIGEGCVIGNSTEVKNAIIFDKAQCPHYNYIGDAVLGYYAHTGAGVILSNLKSDKSPVNVYLDGEKVSTGLKKMSAIVGNHVEVGCNSVLCPGTLIFENSNVYPLTRVRGTLEANMIQKDEMTRVRKREI